MTDGDFRWFGHMPFREVRMLAEFLSHTYWNPLLHSCSSASELAPLPALSSLTMPSASPTCFLSLTSLIVPAPLFNLERMACMRKFTSAFVLYVSVNPWGDERSG